MNKKFTAILISTAMICASAPAFASSFSDVDDQAYAWCVDHIDEMAQIGYVHGYEDGTFRPENEITKLEGIALFSRVMGSEDPANEQVLELAYEQYGGLIESCDLLWGGDELAYMLYKGAFTEADLSEYVLDLKKDQPLSRGEAAIIITKAMGGESEALSNTSISLTYNDSRSIPTNILQYVQYVTDNGIMNGIDDEFRAEGTVTRAQIAVMLSRVAKACDYSFTPCNYISVDKDAKTVTLSVDGETVVVPYTDDTVFSVMGDYSDVDYIVPGAQIIAQRSGEELVAIECVSNEPDESIEIPEEKGEKLSVIYSGYTTKGKIIQIKVKDDETTKVVKTLDCIEDVPITYQDGTATIKSLSTGDALEIVVEDGVVQSIDATAKTIKISDATIDSLDIDGADVKMTISSSTAKYNGTTYVVSSSASVKKNNNKAELSELYAGDTVTITTSYNIITDIVATSKKTTKTGTVVAVTIADQPTLTVDISGKEATYQIPTNCAVTIDKADASIYDIRVGDTATLSIESEAVTAIAVSSSAVNATGSVEGVVTAVNTSYGFIGVRVDDGAIPYTVFRSAKGTTIINAEGKTLDLKSISVGDTVECKGSVSNGAFTATLIIVTKAK